MAPIYSKYLTRNNAFVVAGATTALFLLISRRSKKCALVERRKVKKTIEEDVKYLISEKKEPKIKAQVDRQFVRQLSQLLKIIVPSWTSPEAGYLFLVALSLVARSVCDLWMINNGTKIER